MSAKRRIAFFTLGCKLNYSETSTIERLFNPVNYYIVPFGQEADIYIINTCSVTESADKKCRQVIKKAIKTSPEALIAVVGCYSQLNPDEVMKIPGVDLVLGTQEKFNILEYLNKNLLTKNTVSKTRDLSEQKAFIPSWSIGGRTRSFLKVQDGCDYFCSYCTIPMSRGRSRNASVEEIVNEANMIVNRGVKEIVLSGINIGDFGRTTGETFHDLVTSLDRNVAIGRMRISSIEPNLLQDETIAFLSRSKKFLPHFHIPLQSGSDKILTKMKRKHTAGQFRSLILRLQGFFDSLCTGTDIITGFPGEEEEDFQETYDFLSQLPLSYFHVFSYSERPGTLASTIPGKVEKSEIAYRSRLLQQLGAEKKSLFYEKHAGSVAEVLFEGKQTEGQLSGFSRNYLRVEVPYLEKLVNTIQWVRLKTVKENGHFDAEIIEKQFND